MNIEKRLAHRAEESKVRLCVSALEIIVENAADAARLVAVL